MFKTLTIALAILSFPVASMAQESLAPPVSIAEPGRSSAGDQQNSQVSQAPAKLELDAAAQARVRVAIEALVPEYHARVRRDGQESADRWIGQKAFELGQQEAELMKKRLGLN